MSVLAFLKVSFMNPGYVTNEAAQFNYDLELQPKSRVASTTSVKKQHTGQLKTRKTSVLSKGLGVVTRTDKL